VFRGSRVCSLNAVFEAIHKLASKHFTENGHRQEEFLLRVNPHRVARSQTASGNHAVDMRMMLEFLVPGVEDAEEPDVRAEMFRIAGDLGLCVLAAKQVCKSGKEPAH
jgi:hypothetical protein